MNPIQQLGNNSMTINIHKSSQGYLAPLFSILWPHAKWDRRSSITYSLCTCVGIFSMKLISIYSFFSPSTGRWWERTVDFTNHMQALLCKVPNIETLSTEEFCYFYLAIWGLSLLSSFLILKDRILAQVALESLPLLFNNEEKTIY